MSIFLRVVPVSDAIRAVRKIAVPAGCETVPVADARGRILCRDVQAPGDIPGFARSVVDGYAVIASDTQGAGEAMPAMLTCTGRIAMGVPGDLPVRSGECRYIPTGGVLPAGADAAAMIEYTEAVGDEVLIRKPVAPGENIIRRGEDYPEGGVVLPAGTRIGARGLGVLAAAGCDRVTVAVPPKVGIISTGNELVPVAAVPGPGEVRDANTYLCSGFVEEKGGIPVRYGIVRDDRDSLAAALERAVAECDIVLLSGGSSKDDRDMCADTIARFGEVLIHGIAIAPGKPTIIGTAAGKPVIGLPGHPASAFVVLHAIGTPLMAATTGETGRDRTVPSVLAQNIPSAKGRQDYVRVRFEGDTVVPVFGKSGLLNTLVQSDGMVIVPAGREGLEPGERVEVHLW
ncbi:MAG: molybdenum cofactor biosynthesis protein MoeA [Methanoculleus sp. SDB]|nr:MAG: molybdenum cofactor biosynthesis protein MoeA [Methanoculleus sp. SDB]